jgi:hypothetical protein
MNYDDFRTIWHEALSAARLLPFPTWPTETIDLRHMTRAYSIIISRGSREHTRPFYVTTGLSWVWDALQSARMATTEEDLLIELLGQDGCDLVTERPWLRVDVTLNATLPAYAPLPLSDADAWRRWAREVARRLAPLLPTKSSGIEEERSSLLSWRGDPEVQLQCATDGQLWLTGVSLPAWQGIDLSRQWDDPDREPDFGTESQLADFCDRLSRALKEWAHCLQHLAEDSPKQRSQKGR